MIIEDIKKVLILGAGTMGQQIGLQCAINGYDTIYYDISAEILDNAMGRVNKLASWYVSVGRITEEQLREALDRISTTTDPAFAARDADIISESVPEDPEIKGKVFSQFNRLCPEHTIFTTNTSMLVPSMFADATGRPDRFAALHFHDLRSTNVVDVMPHPGTSAKVTQIVHDFAERIGLVVIMLKQENNGYVFNAMLGQLFLSALKLASRNIASYEDIDRAWMGVTLMGMGPFGIMDQVGLNTVYNIANYWAVKRQDPQAKVCADFLKQYVDKGYLGYKTKKGFYVYPNPAYGKPDFLLKG